MAAGSENYIPVAKSFVSGRVEGTRIASGPEDFSVLPPAPQNELRVHAADFGLSADNPRNYHALTAAIRAARDQGASQLVIPPGEYPVVTDAAIEFRGLRHCTVEAEGAKLVFFHPGGRNPLIRLEDCERFLIRGLTIDWDWERQALASVVKVDAVDPTGRFFDLRFMTPNPGGKVIEGSINPLDPETMSAGTPEADEFGIWATARQEWVDTDLLRLWLKEKYVGGFPERHVGRLYSARHYTYDMHGLTYSDCKHLTFDGVTVHGAPGIAFLGARGCQFVCFTRCSVTRPAGSDRIISATADHCMIRNSRGFVKVEGCVFEYGGDDGINIHPFSHQGVRLLGGPDLVALNVKGSVSFETGDILEFRYGDLSPANYVSRIESVKAAGGPNDIELAMEDPLPSHIPEDAILFNRSVPSHSYIIRDCEFRHNRARGVLAQSTNGVIENCLFEHTQGPAIQIECGSEERWSEGFGVTNLVVRGNEFRDCNANAWQRHAHRPIIYMAAYLEGGVTSYPIFDGILIEDNEFSGAPGAMVYVSSARNVAIRGNLFRDPARFATQVPLSGALVATHASNLLVTGNRWAPSAHWDKPGLVLEKGTTSSVLFEGNVSIADEDLTACP